MSRNTLNPRYLEIKAAAKERFPNDEWPAFGFSVGADWADQHPSTQTAQHVLEVLNQQYSECIKPHFATPEYYDGYANALHYAIRIIKKQFNIESE